MRVLRLIWRMLGGFWSVLMMLLMAGSLALNVAMAVVPAVAAAVGGAVEAVSGVRSLASRNAARTATLEGRAVRAEARLASDAATLRAERAATRAATLRAEQATAEAAAARQVTYRGARRTAAEAVADTSDRVARRSLRAAGRSVTSSFAEALPIVGIGVIAAATAWELQDSCQMLAEIRELDVALNPERAVPADATTVCGMKAPSRDEIWAAVANSPGAVWARAQGLYDGLPSLSLDGSWRATSGMFQATYDWAFGTPQGPEGPAVPPPAGPPSDWNPLNWFDGQ